MRNRAKRNTDNFFNFNEEGNEEVAETVDMVQGVFSLKGFTDSQLASVNNMDAQITQREGEINQIAKSIFTLADIFKELQTMIIDQGTMLDRIDYNVEQVVVSTGQAVKELQMVSYS